MRKGSFKRIRPFDGWMVLSSEVEGWLGKTPDLAVGC